MPEKDSSESLSRELLDLLRMLGDPTLLDYLKELWVDHPIELRGLPRSAP